MVGALFRVPEVKSFSGLRSALASAVSHISKFIQTTKLDSIYDSLRSSILKMITFWSLDACAIEKLR